MIVTEVAQVGKTSNIHINAARAKIATVLCSMMERIGVPFSATPKKERGTNQKKRKTAIAKSSITSFLTGRPSAGFTVSVAITNNVILLINFLLLRFNKVQM